MVGNKVSISLGIEADLGWERKAAAHAEFYTILAGAADEIIASSRRQTLAHLRAGDTDKAALEMDKDLRILHFMIRLTTPESP